MSAHNKLVGPKDHVVVVHMVHDAFIVKIVSLDDTGAGILQDQPQSLIEMAKVCPATALNFFSLLPPSLNSFPELDCLHADS